MTAADCLRQARLKRRLSAEMVRLIDKYHLYADRREVWCWQAEGTFVHKMVKQKFLERRTPMAVVFRFYGLCAAKYNYFSANWHQYRACRFDAEMGFIDTELWDMEFMQHRPSGRYIDLRSLQRITDYAVFQRYCAELEALETPPLRALA